ncbi:D-xylose 1-dehydrogenase (NADP(+)) [Colletotrichum spaethianum]|uniref:D-xylose 1-dehydrogenase (NADP(+), D-xylono-1,5-lactone-forming) n=1 Tax=Colletotrichum spaethianum TaxID=700344 RepID=A0AA37PGD2_9PEZI|nr:D-xylose 1-dehydrogenase (NADP(+)) [Colletotrichum spaethianum]GKT51669.1 D-xylose 1-dehydrogenase (NADP(+)) [Colletotrichum spaethianum]
MAAEPFVLRWGIMATGAMSEYFCKDLLTSPATRNVSDVAHEITAVSSSRDPKRAYEFLRRIDHPSPAGVATYGSYAALVEDPNVDIIYIATPHSHHFQNAMLALQAGKNVLCEKALTVTAEQARLLFATALEKKLFFLEGVWTRFFPLSTKIRQLVSSGTIGKVYRVTADLSRASSSQEPGSTNLDFDDSHRMVNPQLAGGVLLALGIYSLTWIFQILYHLQVEAEKEEPQILSAVHKYTTGIDESAAIILTFPKHGTTGIATSSLRVATDCGDSWNPAVRIQGSAGEIQVEHPAYKPSSFKMIKKMGDGAGVEMFECPQPQDTIRNWGNGTYWEADESARCIRDGELESGVMPWSESVLIMETMEHVLREAGITYPDFISSHEFDGLSPLNTGH